jgi:cytochrome c oxidase subunit III
VGTRVTRAGGAAAAIDVSTLPDHAIGERAPLWWGVLMMVVIESTMFAMLLATYLYVRNEFDAWPPLGTPAPEQLPGLITTIVLLLSAVPQWAADRLACHDIAGNDRAIRWTLVAATVLAFAVLVPRAYEFRALHCRWDSHAYGSIVWTILGMHTFHVLASAIETAVLTVYAFRRPMDEKHRLDLDVNSLYWYFVTAWWLPAYALVYFGPRLL